MSLTISSFPPISTTHTTILILGTMPGKASLAAGQYYAHPRNLFWKLITELLGLPPDATYHERLLALQTARIALWDVVQSCIRTSSLDADIDLTSVVPNDFITFFATHPQLRRVCFNGAKAEELYRKHVAARIQPLRPDLVYLRLPSTSPANASISYAHKYAAWSAALR